MLEAVWSFLKDPANRDVLAWFGGGIVVVAGGVWAVVRFFAGRKEQPMPAAAAAQVTAKGGSVAVGRDNTGPITIQAPRAKR